MVAALLGILTILGSLLIHCERVTVRRNLQAWLAAAHAPEDADLPLQIEVEFGVRYGCEGRSFRAAQRFLRSQPFTSACTPYKDIKGERAMYWFRPGIPYLRDMLGDGIFIEVRARKNGSALVLTWPETGSLEFGELGECGW